MQFHGSNNNILSLINFLLGLIILDTIQEFILFNYTWTIWLHRYYTGILKPSFEPHSQEESNGGNFIKIWSLDGEEIEKMPKNYIIKMIVGSTKLYNNELAHLLTKMMAISNIAQIIRYMYFSENKKSFYLLL